MLLERFGTATQAEVGTGLALELSYRRIQCFELESSSEHFRLLGRLSTKFAVSVRLRPFDFRNSDTDTIERATLLV